MAVWILTAIVTIENIQTARAAASHSSAAGRKKWYDLETKRKGLPVRDRTGKMTRS